MADESIPVNTLDADFAHVYRVHIDYVHEDSLGVNRAANVRNYIHMFITWMLMFLL